MQMSNAAPMIGSRKTGNRFPWEDCKGNCPNQCRKGSKGRKESRRDSARRERVAARKEVAAEMAYLGLWG